MRKSGWVGLLPSTHWYILIVPLLVLAFGVLTSFVNLVKLSPGELLTPVASFITESRETSTTPTSYRGAGVVFGDAQFDTEDMVAITIDMDDIRITHESKERIIPAPKQSFLFSKMNQSIIHWKPDENTWAWFILWLMVGISIFILVLVAHFLRHFFKDWLSNILFSDNNTSRLNKIGFAVAGLALIQAGVFYAWVEYGAHQLKDFSLVQFIQLNYEKPVALLIISIVIFLVAGLLKSASSRLNEQELTI